MPASWKSLRLSPDEPLKIALRKAAFVLYEEMFSFEKGVLEGGDIEDLHEMRVSARRLYAILRIFKDCFPKRKIKRQLRTMKRLIVAMGETRELDIFLGAVNAHTTQIPGSIDSALSLLTVKESLMRQRKQRELQRLLNNVRQSDHRGEFSKFLRLPAKHDV